MALIEKDAGHRSVIEVNGKMNAVLFHNDRDTTAFRLFNGEGDGIGGFTIDYYDGYYLFQWYSKGIYTLKETIMEALDELTDYKAVYEKKRFNTAGQYVDPHTARPY